MENQFMWAAYKALVRDYIDMNTRYEVKQEAEDSSIEELVFELENDRGFAYVIFVDDLIRITIYDVISDRIVINEVTLQSWEEWM